MENAYRRLQVDRLLITTMIAGVMSGTLTRDVLAEQKMNIAVGTPVKLGGLGYINTASLGISRTGVIAAAVPTTEWLNFEGWQWHTYRISRDGGQTWSEPVEGLRAIMGGGGAWATLRGGGVIKQAGPLLAIEGEEGWFAADIARFTDDMTSYDLERIRVYAPDAEMTLQEPNPLVMAGPVFDKGKILQFDNGDLISPMYGKFKGDKYSRVFLTRSVDRGRTWTVYSTVAYSDRVLEPDIPGHFIGFAEPSIALLPGGEMVCVARTQGNHKPPYRPLYICWSSDRGKSWTQPRPTTPPLYNIWPTLQVLDNGVLACVHGRPGFHIAFSLDGGHTWPEKVTFSDLAEPAITGQVDMIKSGPNKLLAIGGVGAGGTQVFPVTVELIEK